MKENKKDNEIELILDLGKTFSFLISLGKKNEQHYVTKEGIAFLEGMISVGNEDLKIVSLKHCLEQKELYEKIINEQVKQTNILIKKLKDKKSWFG